MTSETNKQTGSRAPSPPSGRDDASGKNGEPGWASGLKHLYDSVVDEDLPDTFKDLLSQLDQDEKD